MACTCGRVDSSQVTDCNGPASHKFLHSMRYFVYLRDQFSLLCTFLRETFNMKGSMKRRQTQFKPGRRPFSKDKMKKILSSTNTGLLDQGSNSGEVRCSSANTCEG